MKKLLYGFLGLILTVSASAATLESDITSQGVDSYITKSVSAAQLATSIRNYGTLTAASTLAYTDCGTTYFLNSATEFATTLPTPVAGCYFKFIIKAAPSGANYTIVTNGGSDILIGGVNELEVDTGDDGPYDNNADVITFIQAVAVVGDYVEMVSDGTSWYFNGQTNADGGVTTGTT